MSNVREGTKDLKVHRGHGSVRKIRCPRKCNGQVQPVPNGTGGTKHKCMTCGKTFSYSPMS